jgi:hypothetical protein
MVFLLKELTGLAPYSERTFYRRMKTLKKKRTFKKKMEGNYLTLADALLISELLGFKPEFELFVKSKSSLNGH